jgi:DNA (cytosine-5)-methyltransferase 1
LFSVDLFAGGGGASEGILRATGRAPYVAINHNLNAILMHEQNHPETLHFHDDVFKVNPKKAVGSRPVDLLWASPDCTHFSRAKGGKPKSKKIRGLAWVIVKWAAQVRPRMICMENVPEFLTWGPLHRGEPIKERAGETFADFVHRLNDLGYEVAWKVLVASDFGAPTSRKRLFLIARRDGLPIRWPKPTHGPGRPQPYHTAAECIDWDIPVPSIFDRSRPLAEATERRIAEGLKRYFFESKDPFLLSVDTDGRMAPVLASIDHRSTSARSATSDVRGPLSTVTSKARHVVAAATLIQTGYGERVGQRPRTLNIEEPLGTVVGGGAKHALVTAFLAKHYGGVVGLDMRKPTGTITGKDHHAVVSAHLTKFYGTSTGSGLNSPVPTVTGGGGHIGLVVAFLMKYYSNGGQWQGLDEPMATIVSKARFGLVTVTIGDEEYAVVDIGMRMLQPRELARAQGFYDDYILLGTKTDQIERIGNSVCPDVARAIVEANTWFN